MTYRIGVDVGGTNTDAVVMHGHSLVAWVKTPTTRDVTSGIREALEAIIAKAGIERAEVGGIMIGTTHFTNAVIERKDLQPVAAIRIGLPATACLPPMVDWPDDLREAVGDHGYLVRGGHEYDGREIAPLDVDEIDCITDDIKRKGIAAVAITSVFSPLTGMMEELARDCVLKKCPKVHVVLSSDIGRLGLLERESAAILNASLLSLSARTVNAFKKALALSGFSCPFFITQNDGTLMDAAAVERLPILTFASGPTNSMRGAAFLSGLRNGIVIDVGGTTSDFGSIERGFPRQASTIVDIGGVRTNFRMPDIYSIGLGGGSIVGVAQDGSVAVGPKSVGYRINDEARIFGGHTLTASDIAVALRAAAFGTHQDTVRSLDPAILQAARAQMTLALERGIERCRTSSQLVPVIAVGGGSILVPDRIGGFDIIRPKNFGVANAVGAAIAQISGEVDRIFTLGNGLTRETCLLKAEEEARAKAVFAGGSAETLETIEREDVPLAYLPGNATRIHVKVAGELRGFHG